MATPTPVASAFSVDTEGLTLPPGTAPGDPIWLSGYATPFGSTAPPDFLAYALNNQPTVQVAGGPLGGGVPTTPGTGGCGVGSQVCEPAIMEVIWSSPGTVSPFSANTGQRLHDQSGEYLAQQCHHHDRSADYRHELPAVEPDHRRHRLGDY